MRNIKEMDKRLDEREQEIERLTAESTEWESKCYQLQDIIKEAKEYIESYNLEYLHETNEHNLADILEELLEILDKENK